MKTIDLKTVKRQETGKKATKLLRKQDLIPCILYGGDEVVHFTAETNEFRHLIYTPHVYLVNLKIDDQDHQAVIREIQFHPTTDKILHIDFLEVSKDKPVEIGIPVKVEGFAEGVAAGGKLKIEMRRLKVKGLSDNLPDELTIEVTNIGLGESIKVRDLSFDNLELMDPNNAVVVSVKLTRVAKGMQASDLEVAEAEAAVAEAEAKEGEEAGEDGESKGESEE